MPYLAQASSNYSLLNQSLLRPDSAYFSSSVFESLETAGDNSRFLSLAVSFSSEESRSWPFREELERMKPEWVENLSRRWDRFEQFAIDVVYDRRHGRKESLFGGFLSLFSRVFSGIVQLRLLLYKNRILRKQHLGCQVIVVGNLTVGGTGKTPVVEKFARTLAAKGRKVAILSRGYKSKKEPFYKKWWRVLSHGEPPPPKVVSNGEKVLLNSEVAGDEPYMLARNLPGVIVLVDKNRVKAGSYAIRKFGCDTLILDDGFQYFAIKEQLNLLLVDKTNPFGNRQMLPRGILREPVKHIKRASYIFLTKSDGKKDEPLEKLIRQHHPSVEIIESTHQPKFLQKVNGTETLPLEALKGAKVASFSGIAVPESFEAFLRRYGAEIRYNQRFLDHHRFTERELEEFFENARQTDISMVVTTEKDAVRLAEDFDPGIDFYFLRLEIEILSGGNDFEEAVSRICFEKQERPLRRRG